MAWGDPCTGGSLYRQNLDGDTLMISVYRTGDMWFCACPDSVTCHKDFREAMDAAYRQANRDGAVERSHCHRNNG